MKPIAEALAELSPEVRAELLRPMQSYDPRDAQIELGIEPEWNVFEIFSRDAERDLAKRRFGIYVPECEEVTIKHGRKIERRAQLFPGYVFVFVWPTDENWNRILNIRGIIGSIGSLSESEIDLIRCLENRERPIELQYFEQQTDQPARKRKRRRRAPKSMLVPDEIVRTRAWSAFDDVVHNLDGESRSEALRQMLAEKAVAT